MKKLLFIFTAIISLVAYITSIHADGPVKIYKNGSYTIFHANEVDSVVFVAESSDDIEEPLDPSAEYVGTWTVQYVSGWGTSFEPDDTEFEYIQFKG